MLPGVVPHRNLEKKVRRDRGLICNQTEFSNKTMESVNKDVATMNMEAINNNDAELTFNNKNAKFADYSIVPYESTQMINDEEPLAINNVITDNTELVNIDTEYEETIVIISSEEE